MARDTKSLEDWQILVAIEICKAKVRNNPGDPQVVNVWIPGLSELEEEKKRRNFDFNENDKEKLNSFLNNLHTLEMTI